MKNTKVEKSPFIIDKEDRTVGHIYSRRQAMAMLSAASGTLLLGSCGDGEGTKNTNIPKGCMVRPEIAEGPIFVDDQANRSDIRSDPSTGLLSEGVALALNFGISTLMDNACTPLNNAQVDVWHCDAFGIYSDTNFENMGTIGQQFLRGHQFTDNTGSCNFMTIYPGWYEGRAVHIHFKVRTETGYEFSSQLFFDSTLTDKVFKNAPYNTRGEQAIYNSDDGLFDRYNGDQMILDLRETADGYETTFNIALDMS